MSSVLNPVLGLGVQVLGSDLGIEALVLDAGFEFSVLNPVLGLEVQVLGPDIGVKALVLDAGFDSRPVAARGQGAPGQMTWLSLFYSAAALLAMQRNTYNNSVSPSVCLSVCPPSITRWYPIQMNENRITGSSL